MAMPDAAEVEGQGTPYRGIFGQEDVVLRLKAFDRLYASNGSTPGHILLTGEESMGKAAIAQAFASERGARFQHADARSLHVQGDFTAIVTNLRLGEVLHLANLHMLRTELQGRLSEVLTSGRLTITIGLGPAARHHVMELHPFTLIASCPRRGDCPKELAREFSLILAMQPYSASALRAIVESIAASSGVSITSEASELISARADGRPGGAESLLRRVLRAVNKQLITAEEVSDVFRAFGIGKGEALQTGGVPAIRGMSGVEFEQLVAALLCRMGFQAEVTKSSGDGGIDIVATLDKPIVGGRYLFQCKCFAPDNFVSAPTLRDFYGAVTADGAVKGVFITTSDFTSQARDFGQKCGLELINLDRFQKLLLEYGIAVS